jgi:hypothetical protein
LRQQPGVDQAVLAFGVAERLVAQPVQQFGAVGCVEDGLQCIVLAPEPPSATISR